MTDSTKLMSELREILRPLYLSHVSNPGDIADDLPMPLLDQYAAKAMAWHDEQKKLYADAMLERLIEQRSSAFITPTHGVPIEVIESERQRNGGEHDE